MLVLTRKEREQIVIGDNIVVTVVRTKGNTVRLGIEAPQGIRILRSELADAKPDSARQSRRPANAPAVRMPRATLRMSLAGVSG